MNKKQSAFSLIEVLMALMVLSIMGAGVAKLLSTYAICYRAAENRQKVVILGWSMVEAIKNNPEPEYVLNRLPLWRQKLEAILPGSALDITWQTGEEQCVYTITLKLSVPNTPPINVRIVV